MKKENFIWIIGAGLTVLSGIMLGLIPTGNDVIVGINLLFEGIRWVVSDYGHVLFWGLVYFIGVAIMVASVIVQIGDDTDG